MAQPDQSLLVNELLARLGNQRNRLNTLYRITDKDGFDVPFVMNAEQEELYESRWYLELILKARQLGFSTFIAIYMLDCCLFDKNVSCGIIDITLDDAKGKLNKIKFAYERLAPEIQQAVSLVSTNAHEVVFRNGSNIRVGTSHRGGTLQILHISEYGKICAKFPERAREIRTGALNTLQAGQLIFIESTAEGQEGNFYSLCQAAQEKQRQATRLTKLDFKFNFFGWHKCKDYWLDPTGVVIPPRLDEYFEKQRVEDNIQLNAGQKAWYAKKAEIQEDDMKREFPSTPLEAFEASVEGAYFGQAMATAEIEGRVCDVPYDPRYPVDTIWDIGMNDETAIWFMQRVMRDGKPCADMIDYHERSDEYLEYYVQTLRDKGYAFGTHWLPHDIRVREWGAGKSRVESAIALGLKVEKVPDQSIGDRINAARQFIKQCRFDEKNTMDGRKALKNYRKEWDEDRACYRDKPYHNWASNGADSFGYAALIYKPFMAPVIVQLPKVKDVTNMTIDELWADSQPKRERV